MGSRLRIVWRHDPLEGEQVGDTWHVPEPKCLTPRVQGNGVGPEMSRVIALLPEPKREQWEEHTRGQDQGAPDPQGSAHGTILPSGVWAHRRTAALRLRRRTVKLSSRGR